jgi:phosphatidylglycerophosphate synthase
VLARWIRSWDGRWIRPLLAWLGRRGVRPDQLTWGGLLAAFAAGVALARGAVGPAIWLLGLTGLLDGLDGALARFLGLQSRLGGFVDSIADHIGDCAIHAGLLLACLDGEHGIRVFLILLSLFGSVFGSQVRSRAGMLGIDTRDVGLFTRSERLLVLGLGLLGNRVTLALFGLALLNNLSAAQRIVHVIRRASLPSRDRVESA